MKACCIMTNKRLADLACEIIEVAQTKTLPDGDSVNVPTGLWLDDLIERYLDNPKGQV